MNHLVFLDARAGELEKILSGVKTMLIKESDPAQSNSYPVNPGDSLYFLRNRKDCVVRVKAIVARVLFVSGYGEEDVPHALKEKQPWLNLTEGQYNHWIAKSQAILVEFGSAEKINLIQVASHKITNRSDWIAFEEFGWITE